MTQLLKENYEAPFALSIDMEPEQMLCQSGTINDMTVNGSIDGDNMFD